MLRLPSGKVFAFACLSLVDLLLTFQLLSGGKGTIYETNPLARWFLALLRVGGTGYLQSGCRSAGAVPVHGDFAPPPARRPRGAVVCLHRPGTRGTLQLGAGRRPENVPRADRE